MTTINNNKNYSKCIKIMLRRFKSTRENRFRIESKTEYHENKQRSDVKSKDI